MNYTGQNKSRIRRLSGLFHSLVLTGARQTNVSNFNTGQSLGASVCFLCGPHKASGGEVIYQRDAAQKKD